MAASEPIARDMSLSMEVAPLSLASGVPFESISRDKKEV